MLLRHERRRAGEHNDEKPYFQYRTFRRSVFTKYIFYKQPTFYEASTEEKVEKNEMFSILGDIIDDLPEKEKMVITLYYYEELTLKEIAEIIGVSESRVSQIHSKILLNLRSKVKATIG